MKKYICLLAGAALLAGCEQKETTGTHDYTKIHTPPAETPTKEKTEVNVNTSPNPSP
jgi:PBP1b-binding outer membrane lipoprotein LpoB